MCFKWANKKIKSMKWYNISLIKLSAFAFALMIAKLWDGLLYLDWYWYLFIGIVAALLSMHVGCKK